MPYGKLPYTGLASLSIGGLVINQLWLAGLAAATIVVGFVAVRIGYRRNKKATDK
jgi:hypothetical protein